MTTVPAVFKNMYGSRNQFADVIALLPVQGKTVEVAMKAVQLEDGTWVCENPEPEGAQARKDADAAVAKAQQAVNDVEGQIAALHYRRVEIRGNKGRNDRTAIARMIREKGPDAIKAQTALTAAKAQRTAVYERYPENIILDC